MVEPKPTLDEWHKLYQAAVRIKEIAPWDWMVETDVFGLRNPEADELGFVSVMGELGEHYSIAVYLGPKGLHRFWGFQNMGPSASVENLLAIPHLQASFEDRKELSQKDRDVIKSLGLKFRGQHAWPMFRSYRPGFIPWYLEAPEARFLTHALEQAVEVALRFRENPALLTAVDEDSYLVRVPYQAASTLAWNDHWVSVPLPEPESILLPMDVDVLEHVKQLSRGRYTLEMDFFMLQMPIQEKGARPYLPYTLMVVDADSGMVLGNELLEPQATLEATWGLVPVTVVHQLARLRSLPGQIRVRSAVLAQLLQPLVEELGFQVKQSHNLPMLDQAKEFLLQRFI